ncbi:MAG: hypothetical protein H6628_03800 [Calditrichae bacterium]|nr:hypothetical protein [Calditrichia bacterium]
MTWIKLLFSTLVTVTLFYLLQFPQQNLAPFPVGKFMNPLAASGTMIPAATKF